MTKITEELAKAVSEIKPALVATAGKDGRPNVSPKGSLRVLDDRHLVFADLRSPRTVDNLKENPLVSIIGLNPETRKGWRVWGKAVEIITSGDLFEKFREEYAEKGKLNHVVKILVEEGIVF